MSSGVDVDALLDIACELDGNAASDVYVDPQKAHRMAWAIRNATKGAQTDRITLHNDALEALEWANEHGGLAQVEMDYAMGEGFAELVDGIARRMGLCTDGLDAQDSEPLLMDAIDRRLMPDCLEWPRYEDGSPVRFGDEFANAKGNASTLRTLAIKDSRDLLGGDYFWKLGKGASAVALRNGERVKRPAPPVLAADGKPLEVGQTVWHVSNGIELTVIGLPKSSGYQAVKLRLDDGAFTGLDPDQLTHQRPVLDADGVPIKVGDTVWHEDGTELKVLGFGDEEDGETLVYVEYVSGPTRWASTRSLSLTHTKPEPVDTWERVEKDAGCTATKYNERRGTIFTTKQQVARDLVRRCKALAGVSE